jgi:hypothetical protein
MPLHKEIIYPFFLECCKHTDDVFWENVFEDLAYGKPPFGTYISKGYLCCSYKNKEFSYKICRKDPKEIYDDIYGLLTTKLGIFSQKQKAQKKLDFHEFEKNIKNTRIDWSNIRKKNVKDAMYEKYVIDMKNQHNLSIKQCKYLLSMLSLSLIFKTITSKDITFKDDKIENIESIEFQDGQVIFTRPLTLSSCDNRKDDYAEEQEIKSMRENWSKTIKYECERIS